jgi:hypothetical protein
MGPILLAVDQEFGEGELSGLCSRPRMSAPSRSDDLTQVSLPPYHQPMRSRIGSALVLVLLLGACGNERLFRPEGTTDSDQDQVGSETASIAASGSIVAEPVGADDVHLGDLPKAGVVVGSSEAVVLLDLDGTILATLHGYEGGGNLGAPGVWLKRGPRYFELDVVHGLLMHVGEDRARDVMYDEGPEPSLPPPAGAMGPDGDVAGQWRYALESSSGATLAQWSGECEVPMAYWIDEEGAERLVTGGSDISMAPESLGLGWTANGRAVVFLPEGACGSAATSPGIYLYSSPGASRLVYRTRDWLFADSWGIGL